MGVYIQVDFTDNEGTAFKIEISDPNYNSYIRQVQGKAVLEYPRVKTMDMLRGSVLKMQLEASVTDNYQQRLYEVVGDKKLPVTLYKDGVVFWNGFIKPDGIVESFVSDYWIINIQAVDGLGLLDNIKFLDSSLNIYQGNFNELEILARCLELTGHDMNFRIHDLNLYFTVDNSDPTLSQEAIIDTYVNTDRYVNDDQNNTVFTAKEVLESILKKYGAFVTQQNGKWNIVRIIEFFTTSTSLAYTEYLIDGTQDSSGTIDPQQVLGSEINSFSPCHAGGNQQKNYKPSLGAYKVVYKYGFVASIIDNPKVYWDSVTTISNWTYEDITFFDFTALQPAIGGYPSGYYQSEFLSIQRAEIVVFGVSYNNFDTECLTSTTGVTSEVDGAVGLKFSIKADIFQGNKTLGMFAQLKLIGDSGTDYYLNDNGEWTLSTAIVRIFENTYSRLTENDLVFLGGRTMTISTNLTPESGTVEVHLFRPTSEKNTFAALVEDKVIITNVTVAANVDANVKGESHTATRISNATAVVDTEEKISVGDNVSDLYIGGLEDSSDENTDSWCKAPGGTIDSSKKWKLLNWMVRDRLTISSGNATVFSGSIFGYLPYLGVLSIENIDGLFMTIKWSYDLANNVINADHERIFQDDIYSDIDYSFELESDNVIRPAIE